MTTLADGRGNILCSSLSVGNRSLRFSRYRLCSASSPHQDYNTELAAPSQMQQLVLSGISNAKWRTIPSCFHVNSSDAVLKTPIKVLNAAICKRI
jgi:hypothetical protein